MTLRFGLVLLGLVLAGCASITSAPTGPDPATVERCSAQSGFTARAAEARANGVTGRFDTTAEELAAINACTNGGASPAQVGASAPVTPRLPDVAGVPQTIEAIVTGPTTTTQTFTYGTPPPPKTTNGSQGSVASAANAPSANMVTVGAAPRQQPTPGCVPGHGVFQSGAGYCIGY